MIDISPRPHAAEPVAVSRRPLRAGLGLVLIASLTAPGCAATQIQNMNESTSSMSSGIRARDGNIAIQEEFDAAAQADTVAAWELFIARHPEHELTPAAKERLAALVSK